MKRFVKLKRVSLAISLLALTNTVLHGAIFLQIEGVEGESADANHDKWIDVLSIDGGLSRAGEIGKDAGIEVANFQDLYVAKYVDKSSPLLLEAASSGQRFNEAFIEITNSGIDKEQQLYFEYRLTDILVTSVSTGGSSGEDRLLEDVSLNFTKVHWHYYQYGPDGKVMEETSAHWDIVLNQGGEGVNNTAPTIEPIPDAPTQPGSLVDLVIVINDAETPLDQLAVTVETDRTDLIHDLAITGSGMQRNLSFTTSSLYSGTAGITVRVSDGEISASRSFAVMNGTNLTPFEAFMAANFTAEELLDGQLSSPIGDPDGDDIPTIVEYALVTNPREYTLPEQAVKVSRENTEFGPIIRLNYRRRTDDRNIGPIPWMAPESLLFEPASNNPLYEENTKSGENPFYEDVEGIFPVDPEGPDMHLIRMQVDVD